MVFIKIIVVSVIRLGLAVYGLAFCIAYTAFGMAYLLQFVVLVLKGTEVVGGGCAGRGSLVNYFPQSYHTVNCLQLKAALSISPIKECQGTGTKRTSLTPHSFARERPALVGGGKLEFYNFHPA